MSAYWKLWRDVRGRFVVAVFFTGIAVYSIAGFPVYLRNLPAMNVWIHGVCGPATAAPPLNAVLHPRDNATWHAADCRNQYASLYQHELELKERVHFYDESVWKTTMPAVLLMLGILLAVGAPFSSEEAEATTLTFSLPWSRARWLEAKLLITSAMLVSLIGGVAVLGGALTHFPTSLNYSYQQSIPAISVALPSLLFGLAGAILGIVATMFTRSALAGAISAYIAMYFLAFVDLSVFAEKSYGRVGSLLDVSGPGAVFCALAVIGGGTALAYAHLRAKDL